MDKTARLEEVRKKLKLRNFQAQANLRGKHPHAHFYFESVGLDLGKVRQHASKLLAAGTVSGALLLSSGSSVHASQPLPLPEPLVQILTEGGKVLPKEPKDWLVEQLDGLLPPIKNRWALPFLSREQEKRVEVIVSRATGIVAKASLEGEKLNTIYGVTGYEQHLYRFPGDSLAQHDEFQSAGIAPGLSAWGYFANSRRSLTEDDVLREKYYVAVQTLYLPGWNTRFRFLREWYKYRKVIVVNPENGNAVVAVVGDSGPARWTGKHFGGSPEVMNVLGGPRFRRGRVLLMFVDDSENKVPLGPVDYEKVNVTVVKSV